MKPYTPLQTRIASEPASTERLEAILRAANPRGMRHLPEPEALVAAAALNNTGFVKQCYQSPAKARYRATEVVPDDWLRLAIEYQLNIPRIPPLPLARRTNPPRLKRGQSAIALHRGGHILKADFSEEMYRLIPLPHIGGTRDEAPPGWLAIGALAGTLGLDFTGRRLFEVKHGVVSEMAPEQILPFLELGKWLGFTPSEQDGLKGLTSQTEQETASIGRNNEEEDR